MKKLLSLMVTLCMLIACMAVPMVASADETATNYALASNGGIQSGTKATGNVIDGSMSTSDWIGNGSYIQVELSDYVNVSQILLYTSSYAFTVSYSADGVEWVDLPATSDRGATGNGYYYNRFTLSDGVIAKYVKMTAGMNITTYEFEVYGTAAEFHYLKSLAPSSGTMSPEFSQTTTEYTVQIDSFDNIPQLNYETLSSDAEVAVTPATADNNYTATITVSYGGKTTTYTVKYTAVYNHALASKGGIQSGTKATGNVIDGNMSTSDWISSGSYIQVELSNLVNVSEIMLYTSSYGFSVSYSIDGVEWVDLPATTDRGATGNGYYYNRFSLSDGVIAKYVKMTAGMNITTYEFEVYGSKNSGLPYLKSLSSDAGTWSTAFEQSTTSYKVQVDSLDSLPQLTYAPIMADAEVVYTEASADNNYTATIAVTHGQETLTYTVQFILYNWALPANGTVISGANDAAGIADGDLNTYCYLKNATPVTLTLADYTSIDSIRFYSGSRIAEQYELSYSLDGTAWTELVHEENCTVIRSEEANWLTYETYIPVTAKYVKIAKVGGTSAGFVVNEFEISGSKVEESYTANCAVLGSQVIANVTFLNNTQAAEADKYYLMAVYVGEEIHEIIPVNKAGVSVGAGVAVSTDFSTTKALPEDTDVTARLFVWSDPATIVPVRTPIDVL